MQITNLQLRLHRSTAQPNRGRRPAGPGEQEQQYSGGVNGDVTCLSQRRQKAKAEIVFLRRLSLSLCFLRSCQARTRAVFASMRLAGICRCAGRQVPIEQ